MKKLFSFTILLLIAACATATEIKSWVGSRGPYSSQSTDVYPLDSAPMQGFRTSGQIWVDEAPTLSRHVLRYADIGALISGGSDTTTHTANTVLAGPASGAGALATYRALVAADIPDLTSSYLDADAVRSANTVLAGPATGTSVAPTFRALVAADIPDPLVPVDGTQDVTGSFRASSSLYIGSTSQFGQISSWAVGTGLGVVATGGSTGANGKHLYLISGNGGTGDTSGGNVSLSSGSGQGSGNGGDVDITPGSATGTGVDGLIVVHGKMLDDSGTPTIAAGAGAGTTPTLTLYGTNKCGVIVLTTGAAPVGTNSTIATITYSSAWTGATNTVAQVTPVSYGTATLAANQQPYASWGTTAHFLLVGNSAALAATTTYEWAYNVEAY